MAIIFVHCVVLVGYVHVALLNGLTFDSAEIDRFFLRVVLYGLDNRETMNSEKIDVSTFPNSMSGRETIVQVHNHAGFLGTLASEDIDDV